ncbi:hypothetical protein BDV30DRAFT_135508 [Aspergillus minisclerotigenes]|uniref:Uncharacterized protein n=1 Tax=Aspergillus minisclerotigenes TaxID=656917 RepID=A0A5N6J164_9EURO|nr:hypothetical protein BDV30DRAFT_135508 [Aspergillus minisclerotigenes]
MTVAFFSNLSRKLYNIVGVFAISKNSKESTRTMTVHSSHESFVSPLRHAAHNACNWTFVGFFLFCPVICRLLWFCFSVVLEIPSTRLYVHFESETRRRLWCRRNRAVGRCPGTSWQTRHVLLASLN